jgi:hypothetical protein
MRAYGLLRWAFAALVAVGMFSLPVSKTAQAAGMATGCLPGVLKQRLSQIRSKFGPVRVVSAHRPGARIAGSGRRSFHSSCRAVDFHPPRGKHRAVVAWLKANHGGGVGTYSCGMNHIHIDNGPQVRFHHCVGRSGRPQQRYTSRRNNRNYAARTRNGSRTALQQRDNASNGSGTEDRKMNSARFLQRLTTRGGA